MARWERGSTQFPLPSVVDTDPRICCVIYIPNDEQHISNFIGALSQLSKWNNYIPDPTGTQQNKPVADVWRDIVNGITFEESCGDMPSIMFQQAGDCTLQVSYDGGVTWEDIFNAQTCADQAAQAAIDSALEDGTVAAGGQQPGEGSAPPEVCETYRTQLEGNGSWILPVVVTTGDTVEVLSAAGAWSDGVFGALGAWWCPTGESFLVGACQPGTGGTVGTDPLNTVKHGRLIVNIDGTYYDAMAGTITVPSGVTDAQVIFQMNDDNLTGNGGSINLSVEVCGGAGSLTITPFTDPYACATSGTVSNDSPIEGESVTFTSTLSPDGYYAICQSFSSHSSWELESISLPAGSGDTENSSLVVFHGSHPTDNGLTPGDILSGSTQIGYSTNAWSFTAKLLNVG